MQNLVFLNAVRRVKTEFDNVYLKTRDTTAEVCLLATLAQGRCIEYSLVSVMVSMDPSRMTQRSPSENAGGKRLML